MSGKSPVGTDQFQDVAIAAMRMSAGLSFMFAIEAMVEKALDADMENLDFKELDPALKAVLTAGITITRAKRARRAANTTTGG